MKQLLHFVLMMGLTLAGLVPCAAQGWGSGDLLVGKGWFDSSRPRVPSDRVHQGDMFTSVPLLLNRNADAVARRSTFTYVHEDMLRDRRPPSSVPPYPMFQNPL